MTIIAHTYVLHSISLSSTVPDERECGHAHHRCGIKELSPPPFPP